MKTRSPARCHPLLVLFAWMPLLLIAAGPILAVFFLAVDSLLRLPLESIFLVPLFVPLLVGRGGHQEVRRVLVVPDRHDQRCSLCDDPVGRGVACATCETPHHWDCWKYNGRCTTYACGGREPVFLNSELHPGLPSRAA